MYKDVNKGITSITYNHLNLPTKIVFTGTNRNIVYLYDATGQKVKKVVTNGTTITTTDYLTGYQYENAVLKFFPTAEGYVNNTVINGINNYNYVYNYTDHLGNIRLSYSKDPATQQLKILSENNYYPFGMKHEKYNEEKFVFISGNRGSFGYYIGAGKSSSSVTYKYKYNGKELQETGMYDYGARMYMPDIGRWGVVDGKSEKYVSLSPYHYAGNNPIMYLDVDGNEFTEDAWKWVNKLIADINSRQASNNKDIAKYEAQIKSGKYGFLGSEKTARNAIARLQANNTELETTRGETATLAASSQVYDVINSDTLNEGGSSPFSSKTITGATGFNFKDGKVVIIMPSEGGMNIFSHELKHAYQFETGESGFVNRELADKGTQFLHDKMDEVAGYSRGALFGGQSVGVNDLDDVYGSLPKGPISVNNNPEIVKALSLPPAQRQQALQRIANEGKAFRVDGQTYYKK